MISKEKFVKIVNRLKMVDELQCKINKLYNETVESKISDFNNVSSIGIYFEDIVFDLLKDVFNDTNDWLGYWLYELDYGKDYEHGTVTNEDDSLIDISTPEKLYDFLVENMKESDSNEI